MQSAKKKSKATTAAINEDELVRTGLGLVLDDLRQTLAADHGGIFPHSVLSSQHIALLSSQKPLTMEEVLLIFLVQCIFLFFYFFASEASTYGELLLIDLLLPMV